MQKKINTILNNIFKITPKHLAIAVSGGSDSLAMAFLVKEWAALQNVEITALIVNHNLRLEALEEARLVQKILELYSINTQILHWNRDVDIKSNIQSQARNARYLLLTDFCKKQNIDALLVAHTIDDIAENLFIRILRGSGIDGIAGIKEKSKKYGVRIIRPLLTFAKIELQNYLKEIGINWIEDPSNKNTRFARIKIRQWIEQFGDKRDLLVKRSALTCKNASRAASYIQEQVNLYYSKYAKKSYYNFIAIPKASFFEHDELALRLLKKALSDITDFIYPPRLISLEKLLTTIRDTSNFKRTLNKCIVMLKDDYVLFFPELLDENSQLGKKGWAQLKKLGYERPKEIPVIDILFSLPAVFDNTGKLLKAFHFSFNSKEIDVQ